jgi:monothiol glutaredoxin
MSTKVFLFVAVIVASIAAFRFSNPSIKFRSPLYQSNPGLDEATNQKISDLVTKNKVLLFMKGNKLFPQCGFSNTACRILDVLNTPYETVDVLSDEKVRSGIKSFSSWPTIPQLYVNGEFIGGSDIMIELYNSGELAEMLEIANAN